MTDHDHRHWGAQVQDELAPMGRELRRLIPDTYAAFNGLHRATMGDGALGAATKELIALAIAVSTQCDGCIAAHARGAARRGATREQVAEALAVAILMNGGPGTVYAPRALAAYDGFAAAGS